MNDPTVHIRYEGKDSFGMPIFSCWRTNGGLAGYGHSHEDAYSDLVDKENELVPTPAERDIEDAINEALENGDGK